jgi:hypothetical protein
VKDPIPNSGIGRQFGQLSLYPRAFLGVREDDDCNQFAVVFQFQLLSHSRQPLESASEFWSRSAVSGKANKRLLKAELVLVDEKPSTDGSAIEVFLPRVDLRLAHVFLQATHEGLQGRDPR